VSRWLILLWCICRMSAVHASPVAWGQAQWCVRPALQSAQACEAWRPLALPLAYQPVRPLDVSLLVRLPFVVEHVPTEPLGLYVPYLYHGARVRLNGQLIAFMPGPNGEREVRWERPLLWQITPGMLRQGANELVFDMHPGRDMHMVRMARVEMGDWMTLERQRSLRDFLVRGVPQQAVLMCGFMSMFLALIWLMRPRETLYALLAGALALWGLRTATFLVESLPHDAWLVWRSTYHWATGGFIIVLTWFACRFAQRSVGRWRWWALTWWFGGPLLLMVGGVEWEPFVNRYWTWGLAAIGLFGVSQFFVALRRSGDLATWLLTGAVVVAFLAGVHDLLMASSPHSLSWLGEAWVTQRLFLLHHAANLMLLCLAGVMTRRFVDTLKELGAMNRTLEAKVRERELALDQVFRERAQLMVASATEEERQRIVLDMHDGLGSRLFTTLTRLERGAADSAEMSRSLRACIEDMRLLIDALAPGPQELSAAFASFRYRWDENLLALHLEARWSIADEVLVQPLGPNQVMQILQVLQEALTNVIKHARASQIGIAAWIDLGGNTVFEVVDDGCGMPLGQAHRGRGAISMRRRAERLGGTLIVDSSELGTRVVLTIPAALALRQVQAGSTIPGALGPNRA
jgi:signal transduction histidine kinase